MTHTFSYHTITFVSHLAIFFPKLCWHWSKINLLTTSKKSFFSTEKLSSKPFSHVGWLRRNGPIFDPASPNETDRVCKMAPACFCGVEGFIDGLWLSLMGGNVFWGDDEFTTTVRESQSKRGCNWLHSWWCAYTTHARVCSRAGVCVFVCVCAQREGASARQCSSSRLILCRRWICWYDSDAWRCLQYTKRQELRGWVGKDEGEWKISRSFYQTLFNRGKLPKFTRINEDSSYITRSLRWRFLLSALHDTAQECSCYPRWQCWARTVGSCSALVQTADV